MKTKKTVLSLLSLIIFLLLSLSLFARATDAEIEQDVIKKFNLTSTANKFLASKNHEWFVALYKGVKNGKIQYSFFGSNGISGNPSLRRFRPMWKANKTLLCKLTVDGEYQPTLVNKINPDDLLGKFSDGKFYNFPYYLCKQPKKGVAFDDPDTLKLEKQYSEGKVLLKIYSSNNGNKITFQLINRFLEDTDIRIKLTLNNMVSTQSTDYRTILPPHTGTDKEWRLFELTRKNMNAGFTYNFTWQVYLGNPDAKHDGIYRFKFQGNTKRRIDNAFNGFGAHSSETPYAIDFKMPVSTSVYAARDGMVVRIKKDSNRGGADPSNGPYANYIIVRHDDGTYGNYLHFKQNGVVVNEGQRVTVGKLIGFSGNTGYSTDPHLHFHVSVADAFGKMKTIPFKVYTKKGAKTPTLGMVLGD